MPRYDSRSDDYSPSRERRQRSRSTHSTRSALSLSRRSRSRSTQSRSSIFDRLSRGRSSTRSQDWDRYEDEGPGGPRKVKTSLAFLGAVGAATFVVNKAFKALNDSKKHHGGHMSKHSDGRYDGHSESRSHRSRRDGRDDRSGRGRGYRESSRYTDERRDWDYGDGFHGYVEYGGSTPGGRYLEGATDGRGSFYDYSRHHKMNQGNPVCVERQRMRIRECSVDDGLAY